MQRMRKFLHTAVIFSMLMTLVAVAFPATVGAANVLINPSTWDFGAVEVGTTSPGIGNPGGVTVTNTGNLPFTVDNVFVSVGNQWFDVTGNGCLVAFLNVGQSCTFDVIFEPTILGYVQGEVTIQFTGLGAPPDSFVSVSGSGVAPVVGYNPAAPFNFGNVQIGSTSAQQVITITNNGTDEIVFVAPIISTGNPDFAVETVSGFACLLNQPLAPGSSCQVRVSVTPTTAGPLNGAVAIFYVLNPSGGGAGLVTTSYALKATGVFAEVNNGGPETKAFGNQLVGTESAPQAITITNTGVGPFEITTTDLAGADATDFIEVEPSSNCELAVLLPGESCTEWIIFAPLTAGPKSAIFRVSNPNTNGEFPALAYDILLTGTGTTLNQNVAPAFHNFGSQRVGTTSAPFTFTYTNNSAGGVTLGAVTDSSGEYVILADNCSNAFVAAGGTCTFQVVFAPTVTGIHNADILVGGTLVAQVTGVGVLANITVTPNPIVFPNTQVGAVSAPIQVTVTNNGPGAIDITTVADLSGEFVVDGSNCIGQTLTDGQSCTAMVTFTPMLGGPRSAQLFVVYDRGAGAEAFSVSMVGMGVVNELVISPSGTYDFGDVVVGHTALATFTVTNNGASNVGPIAAPVVGPNPPFSVAFTTCAGATLSPGQSCTIVVAFTPTAPGSVQGVLSVNPVVNLLGNGVSPNGALSASPVQLTFGPQQIGSQSTVQAVIVSNNGNVPVALLTPSVVLSGNDYIVQGGIGNTCEDGLVLDPGVSCIVWVAFQPNGPAGNINETLTVNYTSAGVLDGDLVIALRGIATTPNGTVSPLQLDFGTQEILTTSSPQTVTFTNTGSSVVVIPVVTLAGPNAAEFLIQTDSCSGASVLPGNTCTVSVVFRPTTAGAKNAQLAVGALPNSDVVTLKGIGVNPLLVVSPAGPVDFGSVLVDGVGGAYSLRAFTITNTGSNPAAVPAPTFTGDFGFETWDCVGGLNPLGPGASCTIVVRFDPLSVGSANGTMTINPVVLLFGMGVAANGALSVSPPQLTFGPQQIGTQSGTQEIIVSNNGNVPVTIDSTLVVGTDYILAGGAGNTCQNGAVLAPGESCSLWVAFLPGGPPGPKNSQVNVAYHSAAVAAGFVSVLLRGNAITPNGSVSPLQLNFGAQEVNTMSAPQTVTFTNTGTEIVVVPPVFLGPPNADQFLIQSDSCSGASVLPGDTCEISVTFKPTVAGSHESSLAVLALPNQVVVTLKGIGVDATISVDPLNWDFGNVVIGQSAIKAFTVTNNGSNPVAIALPTLAGSGDFSILSEDCTAMSPLGPGASCTVVVMYAPTSIGPDNGTMTVNPIVTLHGNGIGASGALSVSPVQLTFGNVQVFSMSPTQTITFSNNGTLPVILDSLPTLAGPDSGDFLLAIAGNTCQIGVALNPGESCVVSVAFRPMATGPREAWVNLSYHSITVANGIVSVLLRGVGITPVLSVSPNQLAFGNQTLNTASTAKTVIITNSSNGPLTLLTLGTGGLNPTDFQIVGDLCSGATLAAGTTCQFSVVFLPTSGTGPKNATVIIPVQGLGNVTVNLSGNALAAQQGGVWFTPAFYDFGYVQVGSPTAPREVKLTNNGTAVVTVTGVALAGPNTADFGPIIANSCTGVTLNPGQSCSVWVRFRPLTTGLREASVQFTTDAPGSPHNVYLYGVGISPVLTISPVQLNFGSLQVGSVSAPYTVTVTNSSNGPITLDLSGPYTGDFELVGELCDDNTLAPGGSCTFSITFRPQSLGTQTDAVDIDIEPGALDFEVDLVGVAVTPNGHINPLQLDFGNVQVGTTSTVQTVTFTNTGTGPIFVPEVNLAGPNPGDFLIQTDSCSNAVLSSGQWCQVSVVARPQVQGPRNAQLSIAPSLHNPDVVTLKVNGITPSPQFQANALDFGTQPLNVASVPHRVTVTNNGPADLIIFGSPTISGVNAADFSIFSSSCDSVTLPAGQTCYVDVIFKPLPPLNPDPDIRTAYLDFITNMPVPLRQVPLTGQVGQFSVNVVVGIDACQSVTLSPAGPYAGNDEVTATATIPAGFVFIGWQLDGYYVGFANPIDFKMHNSSHTIQAMCVATPTFSDIAGDPYQTQIEQAAAFGFIKGYFGLSGPFGPNDNFLRSQAAVVMIRMANRTNAWSSEVHVNPFSDQCSGSGGGCVDAESWAAVATGYEKNVIRGLGFGVFAPFSNVTEMETVAFVTRTMISTTLELEQHGRLPACPSADQGIPAMPPLGPASGCTAPPQFLTGQPANKATKWELQPNDGTIYGSVPDGSSFRKEISTYFFYAGIVPGTGNQFNPWPTWSTPARRGLIAAIVWQAYASYYGVDRVDEIP